MFAETHTHHRDSRVALEQPFCAYLIEIEGCRLPSVIVIAVDVQHLSMSTSGVRWVYSTTAAEMLHFQRCELAVCLLSDHRLTTTR